MSRHGQAMKEPASILGDTVAAYRTAPWKADELKTHLEQVGLSTA